MSTFDMGRQSRSMEASKLRRARRRRRPDERYEEWQRRIRCLPLAEYAVAIRVDGWLTDPMPIGTIQVRP